jgi:hypothetical protein
MRGSKLGPVITTAISIKRSLSGSKPVISQSNQIKFWSFLASKTAGLAVSWLILAVLGISIIVVHFKSIHQ